MAFVLTNLKSEDKVLWLWIAVHRCLVNSETRFSIYFTFLWVEEWTADCRINDMTRFNLRHRRVNNLGNRFHHASVRHALYFCLLLCPQINKAKNHNKSTLQVYNVWFFLLLCCGLLWLFLVFKYILWGRLASYQLLVFILALLFGCTENTFSLFWLSGLLQRRSYFHSYC